MSDLRRNLLHITSFDKTGKEALGAVLIEKNASNYRLLSDSLSRKCPEIKLLGTSSDLGNAVVMVQKYQPLVAFVDVTQFGHAGFKLVEQLVISNCMVVVISNEIRDSISAIKLSALDFLLRPLKTNELESTFERIKAKSPSGCYKCHHKIPLHNLGKKAFLQDRIMVPCSNGFSVLPLHEIVSVEAKSGGYSVFRLESGRVVYATYPLNHYETILSKQFFRIHRSFLINMNKVVNYNSTESWIQLKNDLRYQISVRKKSQFRKEINSYLNK